MKMKTHSEWLNQEPQPRGIPYITSLNYHDTAIILKKYVPRFFTTTLWMLLTIVIAAEPGVSFNKKNLLGIW